MIKKITMTNDKAYDLYYRLNDILAKYKTMDAFTSYSIIKNLETLKPAVQIYEQQRNELIKKYGILNEESQTYSVENDKVQDFSDALTPIAMDEISVDFKLIELNGIKGIEPADVYSMFIMINDNDDSEDTPPMKE